MVLLNSLLTVCLIFTLYRFGRMRAELAMLKEKIDGLASLARSRAEENEQEWKNVTNAIRTIADSLNTSFPAISEYMNFSSSTLQYVLVCLRPIVANEFNIAVEREDYERAQECKNLLNSLNRIINNNITHKP